MRVLQLIAQAQTCILPPGQLRYPELKGVSNGNPQLEGYGERMAEGGSGGDFGELSFCWQDSSSKVKE